MTHEAFAEPTFGAPTIVTFGTQTPLEVVDAWQLTEHRDTSQQVADQVQRLSRLEQTASQEPPRRRPRDFNQAGFGEMGLAAEAKQTEETQVAEVPVLTLRGTCYTYESGKTVQIWEAKEMERAGLVRLPHEDDL